MILAGAPVFFCVLQGCEGGARHRFLLHLLRALWRARAMGDGWSGKLLGWRSVKFNEVSSDYGINFVCCCSVWQSRGHIFMVRRPQRIGKIFRGGLRSQTKQETAPLGKRCVIGPVRKERRPEKIGKRLLRLLPLAGKACGGNLCRQFFHVDVRISHSHKSHYDQVGCPVDVMHSK